MTTPQEPTSSRILPFRPRHVAKPARPNAPRRKPTGSPESAAETTDRLLSIRPVNTGDEVDGITHIRAVQLGASTGAFYPHTLTEHGPRLAHDLGISTIEIMLQTQGEYDPAFIRTVAANARSANVRVHSVHMLTRVHPFLDPYTRRVEEAHTLFQRAIEAVVELGGKVLVWHGPNRQQVETEDGWEHFIELAHTLTIACRDAGITLGIENVSYGALAQVRHVVAFALRLNEIGAADDIGFVFDPFQAAEAGANPFMVLAAMGNRIANVHISDFNENDPSARHLLPGDGNLPWSALIRGISSSGYRGPMMIEGPLGTSPDGIQRVRHSIEPLIRSVISFPPEGQPKPNDRATAYVAPPAGVLKGIALFNQGEFYAQHEEIEAEWHAEPGPIRVLYQGILQIGVGFHHAINGNYRGAVSLLADGIEKTSGFLPEALGIDTARLVRESRACLDAITSLGPDQIDRFDANEIPTIVFSE